MATRRVGEGNFDHGTQFFTVRGDRFRRLVEGWLAAGVAEEWSRGFADAEGNPPGDGYPRYRGTEGMTSIPKHLARDLDVRTGERVAEVNRKDGSWEAVTGSGLRVDGEALLVTAPVPQALAIAESGDFRLSDGDHERLDEVSYDPCIAVMALLDGPSAVPEPGGVQIKGEPLDWIGDNQQKGISPAPGLTVHGGPGWSREHWEATDEEVTDALLRLAGQHLGSGLGAEVLDTSVARWRYSWVTRPYPEPYLAADSGPPLLFAGDAFGQPKVEGASMSGLSAADRLLGREG